MTNLFDQFGGSGGGMPNMMNNRCVGAGNPGTVVIPQMSASCPAYVKEEIRALTPGEQGILGKGYHMDKLWEINDND